MCARDAHTLRFAAGAIHEDSIHAAFAPRSVCLQTTPCRRALTPRCETASVRARSWPGFLTRCQKAFLGRSCPTLYTNTAPQNIAATMAPKSACHELLPLRNEAQAIQHRCASLVSSQSAAASASNASRLVQRSDVCSLQRCG